ncbi:TetR/AcrR family transcriptional regulator [Klebsiella aerogenes]|nr:TetR/AcrR family transcriptional regulator [Klebsiella aerogenes]
MLNNSETYHKLIVAAAACFAEKGFNGTSVREIALRAGISLGAMYTYFKGKDELIEAIILEEQKSALAKHQERFEGSHFAQICALAVSCIEEVGYPSSHQLWVEIIAESARKLALRQIFVNSDRIMRDGMAQIITRGIAAGELSPHVNVEEATLTIFALIDGLIGRKAMNPAFSVAKDLPHFDHIMATILDKNSVSESHATVR